MPLMRPFVIDCDTGRDDALTLWYALTNELPLVAVVASYGNVSLPLVADNTARVIALAGKKQPPLILGLEQPQRTHRLFASVVQTRQQSCGNGLCDLELPASTHTLPTPSSPDKIASKLQALAEENGPLDYFIIGPASNFAATAKFLSKALSRTIARVTMMGGKLSPLWDQIPGADFNIASDPYAVDEVMRLGLPMRFVPMNATWPIFISLDDIEKLRPLTRLAEWAQKLMIAHCRYFAPEPLFRFHDPSVILAALHPEAFIETRLTLACDESSPDFGRLTESIEGILCSVYRTDDVTRKAFKNTILQGLGFEGF